ncbi:hypothetical protein MMC12_004024, partial [Toensbergia leucococca]|nr:hypothetical protein [Toensbergia leucococca]
YQIKFSTLVSKSCAGPPFGASPTYFPALGVTSSYYVLPQPTGEPQWPYPAEETFLSLINATSCYLDGDGAPGAHASVAILTVTSSFTANLNTRMTASPSAASIVITNPSVTLNQVSLTTKAYVTSPSATTVPDSAISKLRSTAEVSSLTSNILISAGDTNPVSRSQLSTSLSTLILSTPASPANTQVAFNPSAASAIVSSLLGNVPPEVTSTAVYAANNPSNIGESAPGTQTDTAASIQIQGSQDQVGSQATSVNVEPSGVIIGSSAITANAASQFVVSSSTLIPGGAAVNIDNTPLSLAVMVTPQLTGPGTNTPVTANLLILSFPSAGSSAVVNAISVTSQIAPQPPIITIGGSTIRPNAASEYVVGTQTLDPGSAGITVSSTVFSLAPSAIALGVGGNTQALVPTENPHTPPLLTIADSIVTPNSASQYLVGSQTLAPGLAITISGSIISLAPSATAIAINGITTALPPSVTTPRPILTLAGQTITPNAAGQYIIESQTLAPGSAITISSSTISLVSSGTAVVINGITFPLPTTLSALTLGGTTLTPNIAGQYTIGTLTLTPGAAITVDGIILSLVPSGTAGGEAVTTLPLTTSELGALIMSGLGFSFSSTQGTTTTGNVAPFTGAAAVRVSGESVKAKIAVAVAAVVLAMALC